MLCPLRAEWRTASCKQNCYHRTDTGKCVFKEHQTMSELPDKERTAAIVEQTGCTRQQVANSVRAVRAALVADAFIEYLLGKSLLDITSLPVVSISKFDEWNKTNVRFDEVISVIETILFRRNK